MCHEITQRFGDPGEVHFSNLRETGEKATGSRL